MGKGVIKYGKFEQFLCKMCRMPLSFQIVTNDVTFGGVCDVLGAKKYL